MHEDVTPKGNGKWPDKVKRVCLVCNAEFLVQPAVLKRPTAGRYCSRRCRQRSTARPLADRLMNRVRKTSSCWFWEGATTEGGYGVISLDGKTQTTAHRASWIVHKGPIPDGIDVLHKCDVRPCVNPDCLFLGTQKENMEDKVVKGRGGRVGPKGSGQLNPVAVRVIRFMWENRQATQIALARAHRVHPTTIKRAILREIWDHVD